MRILKFKITMERVSRTHNPQPMFVEVQHSDDPNTLIDRLADAIYRVCKRYIMSIEWEVEVIADDVPITKGKVQLEGGRFGTGVFELMEG